MHRDPQSQPAKFQHALEVSLRVGWRLEDVLPDDARLDLERCFLPDALARVEGIEGLSALERRTLNQIRGHSYLRLFGLVEEFILPFLVDHARSRLGQDDFEVRALLQFASEEAKHIQLFRRFAERFEQAFGGTCPVIGPAASVAEAVLAHDPLGVGMMILHIGAASVGDGALSKSLASDAADQARSQARDRLKTRHDGAAVGRLGSWDPPRPRPQPGTCERDHDRVPKAPQGVACASRDLARVTQRAGDTARFSPTRQRHASCSKPPMLLRSPRVRAQAIGLVLLALGGCAAALETSQVSRRFRTLFGCANPHVMTTAGGYRVEGCGTVAHFRCFDTDDDIDENFDEGGLGKVLVGALFDEALESDTCLLEHTAHTGPRPVADAPAAVASRRDPAGVVLKARTLFAGGHLRLLGKPALHPHHALLSVHSTRALAQNPCTAELFHDGVPVPVARVERHGSYEARLLIRVGDLRDADQAARFAGSACGASFELDPHGRKVFGLFEARFREELAKRPLGSTTSQATPSAAD